MRNTVRLVIVLCIVALASAGITIKLRRASTANTDKDNRLIVHEWGTFTSIAGKNGFALDWRPLNGSSDLPKFVHTMPGNGLRHGPAKLTMEAQIRMETPVIYFYSNREMTVQAEVSFPNGKITEWYPQARSVQAGINWGTLKILPNAAISLPADYSNNHYYAARNTDAAIVELCGTGNRPDEQEKFLFYRGVGSFELPLKVQLESNRLRLANRGQAEVRGVFVFEKRAGQVGYRYIDKLAGETIVDRPALDSKVDSVIEDLRRSLVASGLYQKEADAMIETWRNSWFEDGMRVFYLLPRSSTDAILPLKLDPQPDEIVRVLVGRTEVITPEMESTVREQVRLLNNASPKIRAQAQHELKAFGRFYEPILKQILEEESNATIRAQIEQILKSSASE